MPNWTRNVVEAKGINKIDIFNEKGDFDFEKLIPMPESLNMTSGGMNEQEIMYYITEGLTIPYSEYQDPKLLRTLITNIFSDGDEWLEETYNRTVKTVSEMDEEEKDELFNNGKQLVSNYKLYGATTWYDWSCANWGTKWNACDTEVTENMLCFNTAWSCPHPVLLALSEKYPEMEFKVSADYEDDWDNTFVAVYKGGVVVDESVIEHPYEEFDSEEEE